MVIKNLGYEYVGIIYFYILIKLYVVNMFYIDIIYYIIYFFLQSG